MRTSYTLTIIILLTILINSCGTTHHFIPPRPLEQGEREISVTWYYDFDAYHLPAIIPDLNIWYGVDNTNTVGFGYQFPLFMSHLSFAKYFNVEDNSNSNLFIHLNQPYGLNNNPYIEIGGSYSKKNDYFWSSTSAGLAYGNGALTQAGLFSLKEIKDPYKGGANNKIIPFAKFQLGGQDLALSYNYYFGLKNTMYANTLKYASSTNDTVLVLPLNIIDSITIIDTTEQAYFYYYDYAIYLATGDTITLEFDNSCSYMLSSYVDYNELEYLMNVNRTDQSSHFARYLVHAPKKMRTSNNNICLINIKDFLNKNNNSDTLAYFGSSQIVNTLPNFRTEFKDTLVFKYYPLDLYNTLGKIKNNMNNHSIGISIQNYNK